MSYYSNILGESHHHSDYYHDMYTTKTSDKMGDFGNFWGVSTASRSHPSPDVSPEEKIRKTRHPRSGYAMVHGNISDWFLVVKYVRNRSREAFILTEADGVKISIPRIMTSNLYSLKTEIRTFHTNQKNNYRSIQYAFLNEERRPHKTIVISINSDNLYENMSNVAMNIAKSFEIEGKPELSWKPFEQVEVVNTKNDLQVRSRHFLLDVESNAVLGNVLAKGHENHQRWGVFDPS